MCDICVMASVQERMLNRRDLLFRGGLAAGAVGLVAAGAPAPRGPMSMDRL